MHFYEQRHKSNNGIQEQKQPNRNNKKYCTFIKNKHIFILLLNILLQKKNYKLNKLKTEFRIICLTLNKY